MNVLKVKSRGLFWNLLSSICVLFAKENDEIVNGDFMSAFRYNVVEVDRTQAYGVYKIRRDLVNRSDDQFMQFDKVLDGLLNFKEEKVLIHLLNPGIRNFLFFTSTDCRQIFGYISVGNTQEDA